MDIRAGTHSDLPGIRDVANRSLATSYADVLDADARQHAVESWYGTGQSSPSVLGGEIEDDRTIVLVAEDGAEIVGFAQAFLSGSEPRVGRIEWIHVRPDRRDEGVGDDLLDGVETALTDAGADRVEARVIEANTEGRAFYEEHGYDLDTTREVRIDEEPVPELTLVTDADGIPTGTERRETDDGKTVVIATDEREQGTNGPFHATYLDEDREERYGWHCGVCDGLDVNVGPMGEIVCDDCGNQRRPRRWDAAYGG